MLVESRQRRRVVVAFATGLTPAWVRILSSAFSQRGCWSSRTAVLSPLPTAIAAFPQLIPQYLP